MLECRVFELQTTALEWNLERALEDLAVI